MRPIWDPAGPLSGFDALSRSERLPEYFRRACLTRLKILGRQLLRRVSGTSHVTRIWASLRFPKPYISGRTLETAEVLNAYT